MSKLVLFCVILLTLSSCVATRIGYRHDNDGDWSIYVDQHLKWSEIFADADQDDRLRRDLKEDREEKEKERDEEEEGENEDE